MTRAFRLLPSVGILLACLCTEVRAQWSVVPTGYPNGLFSITTMGNDQSLMCGSTMMLYSTDAGDNWTWHHPQVESFGTIPGKWPGFHFFDTQTGIAVGSGATYNEYVILRTTNGGTTWSMAMLANDGDVFRRLNAVSFPDANTGYAAGTNGRLYKTVNAGVDWSLLSNAYWSTSELVDVEFWDADHGLVLTATTVLRTEDGGDTWSYCFFGEPRSMCIVAGGTAYVTMSNVLKRSWDFGYGWSDTPTPFDYPYHVAATGPDTVFLAEWNRFYRTTNGAESWEVVPGIHDGIVDSHFINDSIAYAVSFDTVYTTVQAQAPGLPYGVIDGSDVHVTPACGSTTVQLTATWFDPNSELTWKLDGVTIGSGPTVSYAFTADTTATFQLVLDNGVNTFTVPYTMPVAVQEPPVISAGADGIQCFGGSVHLHATGSTNYLWSPPALLDEPTTADPVATVDVPTTFIVETTVALCTVHDSVFVDVEPPLPEDQWTTTNTPTSTQNIVQDVGVVFPDGAHGFMFCCGKDVLKSDDGGATWTGATLDLSYDIEDICMLDRNTGFISAGALYKTENAWTDYQAVGFNQFGFDRLLFLDDLRGLGCSMQAGYGIFRTTDGGMHWYEVWEPINNGSAHNLIQLGGDTIIAKASSNGSVVLRSIDGGQTWTTVFTPSVSVPNVLVQYGDSIVLLGARYRSEDAGSTWVTLPEVDDVSFPQDMALVDPDTAFARGGITALWKTPNGGACWQDMQFALPGNTQRSKMTVSPWGVVHIASHQLYVTTDTVREDRLDDHALPLLDFDLSPAQLCSGGPLVVTNLSHLVAVSGWYLDGVLWSGNEQPPALAMNEPGIHEVMLVGLIDGTPDTLIRSIEVVTPAVTDAPLLVPQDAFCINLDTNLIIAVPPANASSFDWRMYRPTLVQWFDQYGQDDDTLYAGSSYMLNFEPNLKFKARARDAAGCPGPWSQELDVALMDLYPESWGSISHSLDELECVTQGETDEASTWYDPAIDSYFWHIVPEEAATFSPQEDGTTIYWNTGWSADEVTILVDRMNVCGASTLSVTNEITGVNYLQQEFEYINAELGQTIELEVFPTSDVGQHDWFLNGSLVQNGGYTYTIGSMTYADTGTYSWVAYFPFCDGMDAPVAHVAVGPVGVDEPGTNEDLVQVAPVPASDLLHVVGSGNTPIELAVHDALGRRIWREQRISRTGVTIDVSTWADGAYSLKWSSEGRSGVVPFVVQH